MKELKDLKVGDPVVVIQSWPKAKYIQKVLNITPKGNIRTDHGLLFTPDGKLKGGDEWHITTLIACTPEIREEIEQERTIQQTLQQCHELKKLTYAQALQIQNILKGE